MKNYNDVSEGLKRGLQNYGSLGGETVMNPGKVDEAKWEKAKAAASKSGYRDKYAVVTEIYKKMGGTFHHKE